MSSREIKGTDPKLKDEVVMLGGHLDSWIGATGATDNAAGMYRHDGSHAHSEKQQACSPRRTIRIALWSGEEEGLLGSRGYVKKTFGDPATMQLLPAHEKICRVFQHRQRNGKGPGYLPAGQ